MTSTASTKVRVGAAVLGLSVVGISLSAPAASAHTPSHSASCEGVTGSATKYDVKAKNTITVTVGDRTETKSFEKAGSLTISVPQDYGVYEWAVTIDAPGKQYDGSWSGEVGPCGNKPDVADAKVDIGVTPATCTAPQTVVYGKAVNATFNNGSTKDGTQGPGNYRVSATADKGHTFKDGTREQTLRGELTGDLSKTQDCNKPGEPTVTSTEWVVGEFGCGDTTVTQTRTVTTTPKDLWNPETGTYGPNPDAATTATETGTRDLTADERTECPVVTPPTEPEPTPTPTETTPEPEPTNTPSQSPSPNPTAHSTAVVVKPKPSTVPPSAPQAVPQELAYTGSDLWPLVYAGSILLALGTILIGLRRKGSRS